MQEHRQEDIEKQMDRIGIYETPAHPSDEIREYERREQRPCRHDRRIRGHCPIRQKEENMRTAETDREADNYFFERMQAERKLEHEDGDEQLLHEHFGGFRKEIPRTREEDVRRRREREPGEHRQ